MEAFYISQLHWLVKLTIGSYRVADISNQYFTSVIFPHVCKKVEITINYQYKLCNVAH